MTRLEPFEKHADIVEPRNLFSRSELTKGLWW